jgi:arylamine N-acetyltransferase
LITVHNSLGPMGEPTTLTQLSLEDEHRPRYSLAQLQDYFRRIELPQEYIDSPVLLDTANAGTKEHGLPFLHALARHHVCAVPFEDLELHYSAHKTVSLDPTHLYRKFVEQRRGGRCMENNTFFATVIRSLGFDLRNCAGRVSRAMSPYSEVRQNQSQTYDGWNHMLNMVRLDDEWYVVDVGMGAMGPNMPYPLRDGFETISIAPRKIRLQLRPIAESYAKKSSPRLWCYDVCYDPAGKPDDKWIPTYCFTETEFLPQDYETMSWFTSTHPSSFFTRYVTCTKMIMDEEKIIGNNTLFVGTIRETIGSSRKVVRECTSEDERVQALKEIFDVTLTEEEKNSISKDLKLG